jgi:hypothetical protein
MSFLERMKAKAKELATEELPIFATDEVVSQRLAICEECPSIRKPRMQCVECGCLMLAKTKLKSVSCPLGKW